MNRKTRNYNSKIKERGFSLIELIIALTITIIILTISFTLLVESLRQKFREDAVVSALADGNQALNALSNDLINAGMGIKGNGILAANSGKNFIRIRSNLNAFMKQTSSNTVTDTNEDIAYLVVPSENGQGVLVKMDVNTGTVNVIASKIDNSDIDNDGAGDGVSFTYLDVNGNQVSADSAVQLIITLRLKLPQQGTPKSPGYKPETILPITTKVFLRNSYLISY